MPRRGRAAGRRGDPVVLARGSVRASDPRTLVVDALLGTGLSGAARGLAATIIEDVAGAGHAVVAVDLPSGLSGDSADVPGPVLSAEISVALCRPKIAHVLPPACLHAGRVEVVDIGIPARAVDSIAPMTRWIDAADLKGFLPRRPRDAHKGAFGHVLVVAGSEGMAGAAALASRAALRSGAGLATVMTPAAVRAEVASFTAEVMTSSIPAGPADGAARRLLDACRGKTSVAAGPGLGRDARTADMIRRFVAGCRLPLVLDADGLNAFAGRLAELSRPRRGSAPSSSRRIPEKRRACWTSARRRSCATASAPRGRSPRRRARSWS